MQVQLKIETTGEKIRIARLRRRWTQAHLANFADRTNAWLSFVERGRIIPRAQELERLAAALGVTVRYLMDSKL